MNRSDIVRSMSLRSGITPADAEKALDAVIETIASTLACGEDVQFRGFGKFVVRVRKPVIRYNPRTGGEIKVPAKLAVSFTPSQTLKVRMNRGQKQQSTSVDNVPATPDEVLLSVPSVQASPHGDSLRTGTSGGMDKMPGVQDETEVRDGEGFRGPQQSPAEFRWSDGSGAESHVD